MKKLMAMCLLLGLMIGGVFGLGVLSVGLKPAEAQSVTGLPASTTTGTGIGDPFSGKGEMIQTWTGTLATTGTPATVITSTSAGTRVSIKNLEITCATAQFVDLYDGTAGLGANVLAHIYCAANTPHQFTRDLLGTGITTSLGNSLCIVGGNTGACYIVAAVQRPTQ